MSCGKSITNSNINDTTNCTTIARRGLPSASRLERPCMLGMVSNIFAKTRGPVKTMELMVDTSNKLMIPPINLPMLVPSSASAATKPTSFTPTKF